VLNSQEKDHTPNGICTRSSGTDEFLYGQERWILYLDEISPTDIRPMPAGKATAPGEAHRLAERATITHSVFWFELTLAMYAI